jgi:hypothetical protein
VVRPNLTNWASGQHSPLEVDKLSHLLLFHELRIRAVIDDVFSKNRGSERGVDLFGIDILQLAVEDEFVALCADIDGHLPPEHDEGEHIAMLRKC